MASKLPMQVSPQPSSSLWTAVGAGIVGVVFGAAAIHFAGRTHPQDLPSHAGASMLAPSDPRSTSTADRLASAVSLTRDSVVNLSTSTGIGAGVIVDATGIILTNHHVIATPLAQAIGRELAPPVTVRFENGRELKAEILVADREQDLAVLRVVASDKKERFSAASVGSSADLEVGQQVFAIGNPFGLQHSVSQGIVAALDRIGILANRSVGVIQLDASINLGNSGGPLFNLEGELVGIVTARQERAQGIAFAIPIDHVRGFLRAITEPGGRRSGMIGVLLDTAVPPSVNEAGYEAALLVKEVRDDSPADRAQLQSGDAIVAAQGRRFDRLESADDPGALVVHLQELVRSLFPGERLPLTVVRGDETLDVEVEVGSASMRDQTVIDADQLWGLILDRASDAPVIEDVRDGSSLAAYRGQLRGATIVGAMGAEISDLEDLGQVLAALRQWNRSGLSPAGFVAVRLRDGTTVQLQARVQ